MVHFKANIRSFNYEGTAKLLDAWGGEGCTMIGL